MILKGSCALSCIAYVYLDSGYRSLAKDPSAFACTTSYGRLLMSLQHE